ncbi:Putative translation initiation inhibitor YoaB [Pseudoalteromonas luteoviolacea B = ATCC 29581]|nr:Putative translation initiation inhibitor YoaB [Pseudoalteromonas luteoviolacea B = ATCC 29581]
MFNNIGHFVEVAEDPNTDIESQAAQIFAQAEATMAQINSDKTKILSVTIYLTDFAYLDAFNQAWDAWLKEGTAPSRACVQAQLADPAYKIEICFVVACQ